MGSSPLRAANPVWVIEIMHFGKWMVILLQARVDLPIRQIGKILTPGFWRSDGVRPAILRSFPEIMLQYIQKQIWDISPEVTAFAKALVRAGDCRKTPEPANQWDEDLQQASCINLDPSRG